LSTRLTVASLTPAFLATSARRLVTAESYVSSLQISNLDLQSPREAPVALADRVKSRSPVFPECCTAWPERGHPSCAEAIKSSRCATVIAYTTVT
jgi:hypothetical protein